jgi:methylated-DNA-[protein]-cysteine S-methyltransferase
MMEKRNAAAGKYRSLFITSMGCGGVVASVEGLVEIFLPFAGESENDMGKRIARLYPLAIEENLVTREAARLLEKYFAGEKIRFGFPIDRRGFTPFQSAVYEVVTKISRGTVLTYAEVAALIGRPRAARGIGSAMARNPLPVVIPCHRVVGASGALTGYSGPGGIMSKRWLLDMEGVVPKGRKGEKQKV